jgi:hypothetical protein
MNARFSGHYYSAPLSDLLDRLEIVEKEIAVLEVEADKPSAYQCKRKRRVLAKMRAAVRSRLAWHQEELRKGVAAGFAPSEHFEPRTRSINYPKTRASAHA